MWWLPIAAFAQNKMQEKKAKEEAAKLQTHAIRSQLAQSFGAPTYGAQTARSMYDTQRQIDAQAAQNNQAMMSSAFGKGGFTGMEDAVPDAPGAFADQEDDSQLTPEEIEEWRKRQESNR